MYLRRKGSLRRKTRRMQKDGGQAEWAAGLFFILILVIVLLTRLQLAEWEMVSVYLEDALAASNLAAALIDVEEYGTSHKVLIGDPVEAYQVYRAALAENLQLDWEGKCANRALISGVVRITDFVIYNVDQNQVEAVRVRNDQSVEYWRGKRGAMKAPNGVCVEYTGIYSEISFPLQGFLGVSVEAHKAKLVDIVPQTIENGQGEGYEKR